LIGRALLQQHSKRRKLSALWAPPVPAELRCDVHLVEVRGAGQPPEPHRDLTARPAARDDRLRSERRVGLGSHVAKLATCTERFSQSPRVGAEVSKNGGVDAKLERAERRLTSCSRTSGFHAARRRLPPAVAKSETIGSDVDGAPESRGLT
jgi:hypothetical protein